MCKKMLAIVLVVIMCLTLFAVGTFAETAQVSMSFAGETIRVSQSADLIINLPDDVIGFSAYFADNGKLGIDRNDMVYDSVAGKYKLSVQLDENTNSYAIAVKARYTGTAKISLTNIVCETANGNVSASDVSVTILVKPAATPIYTKEELNAVRNNLSGNYILMNDIAFEESDFEEGGAFYNNGYGWQALGASLFSPFKGEFDGNGYSITGLKILKADYNYIGLFGVNTGTIENLALTDLTVDARYGVFVSTGDSTSASGKIDYESEDVWTPPSGSIDDSDLSQYDRNGKSSAIAGAFVGYNVGNISNCFAGGYVFATPVAGGIAGSNVGNIKECYVDAEISAKAAGGIVGYNLNHGEVTDCHTKCIINSSIYGGGICAENRSSTIKYCYSLSSFGGVGDTAAISNGTYYSEVESAYYLENEDFRDSAATALSKEEFVELRFVNNCWDYSGNYPVLKKLAKFVEEDDDQEEGGGEEPPIIEKPDAGDIDGDGVINTTDLALLKKLVANLCDETEAPYGDVNEDGDVNTTDLALLKKMIAGL